MKLYHGSSVVVRKPLIARGRKTTDFGKGFYTTTDFEQAARWARIKRERLGHGKAVVSVYDLTSDSWRRMSFRCCGIRVPRRNGWT